MLVLENTHTRAGGTILSPELTADLARAAQSHGAYVHLDGARLFNAAVALGVPVSELAARANTVAVSLNKGLCAPMGAILAGRTQVIELAQETLRRVGGASVHKAGIAAAAALVALDTLVERLADDHRRASELGALLQEIPGLEVEPAEIETNIVLVDVSGTERYPDEFLRLLAERGILGREHDTSRVRFVTHRQIERRRCRSCRGARRPRERAHSDFVAASVLEARSRATSAGAGKYHLQERIGVRDASGTSLTPASRAAVSAKGGGLRRHTAISRSSSVGRWMMSSTTCSSTTGMSGPKAWPVTDRRPSIVCLAEKNG